MNIFLFKSDLLYVFIHEEFSNSHALRIFFLKLAFLGCMGFETFGHLSTRGMKPHVTEITRMFLVLNNTKMDTVIRKTGKFFCCDWRISKSRTKTLLYPYYPLVSNRWTINPYTFYLKQPKKIYLKTHLKTNSLGSLLKYFLFFCCSHATWFRSRFFCLMEESCIRCWRKAKRKNSLLPWVAAPMGAGCATLLFSNINIFAKKLNIIFSSLIFCFYFREFSFSLTLIQFCRVGLRLTWYCEAIQVIVYI